MASTTLTIEPLTALWVLARVEGPATPRPTKDGTTRPQGSGRAWQPWRAPLRVAMAIAACADDCTDEAGWVRVSMRWIADHIGAADGTVQRAMAELRRCEVIEVASGVGTIPLGVVFTSPDRWKVRWSRPMPIELAHEVQLFPVEQADSRDSARLIGARSSSDSARSIGARASGGSARSIGARGRARSARASMGRALSAPSASASSLAVPSRPDGDATSSAVERASQLDPTQLEALAAITGEINRLSKHDGRHGRGHLAPGSKPHQHLADVIATVTAVDVADAIAALRAMPGHLGPPALARDVAEHIRGRAALAGVHLPEPPAPSPPVSDEERRRRQVDNHRRVLPPEVFAEMYPDEAMAPAGSNQHNEPPEVGAA